jgi:hypothetical protein
MPQNKPTKAHITYNKNNLREVSMHAKNSIKHKGLWLSILAPLVLLIFPNNSVIAEQSTATHENNIIKLEGRWIDTHANAPLVAKGEGNVLLYGLYANEKQINRAHILPDFSYAGYQKGGVALPSYDSLPIKATLIANGIDDTVQIQKAITEISTLPPNQDGIRGVILLSAGDFLVSEEIIINTSGVIIRGEGQGKNGTTLKSISTKKLATVITFKGEGNGRTPKAATAKQQTNIIQDMLPVGSRSVQVATSEGYKIGDEIAIVRTPNALWLSKEGINMAQFDWTPKSYTLPFERTIIAIVDNTLIFDIPMVDTIETQFGGGYIYRIDVSQRLNKVGLENIQLQTLKRRDLSDENRAFYGVKLGEVQNSWVRDVTVKYLSHAYNLEYGARFNTLQDIAFVEPNFKVVGGRHYGFNFTGGSFNLYQRCYGNEIRHTFVTGSRITGPNVFLDCLAENSTNDSGPHHRWTTGTLYDNTKGEMLRVQNRKDSGSGHGWAGAQQMFWNNEHEKITLQTPPYAMNWAVGVVGNIIEGQWSRDEANGIYESFGKHVTIRSLYLAQLQERLGDSAVNAITIPEQRIGTIWSRLKNWRGESMLSKESTSTVHLPSRE